jgi:hypothetical protein
VVRRADGCFLGDPPLPLVELELSRKLTRHVYGIVHRNLE